MKTIGVLVIGWVLVGSNAFAEQAANKKELTPAFKCIRVHELDRTQLDTTKRNYQLRISEEEWKTLPRLIRVDLEYVPKSGNKGGGWANHIIYPHEDFKIQANGKGMACIGAVRTDFVYQEPDKFKKPNEGKLIQIYNKISTPGKPSWTSIVFLVPENWGEFDVLFKDNVVVRKIRVKK